MDNNKKKEKIVAIVSTTLVSLAVSIIACIFGISPEAVKQYIPESETTASNVCVVDIETF